jgi:peroxiredoxin
MGHKKAAGSGESSGLVLMSDRNVEVVGAYGVKPIEINGSTYASRATFVIDKQGVLRYVNYNYKIYEDFEPLMKALGELN